MLKSCFMFTAKWFILLYQDVTCEFALVWHGYVFIAVVI